MRGRIWILFLLWATTVFAVCKYEEKGSVVVFQNSKAKVEVRYANHVGFSLRTVL